MYMTPTCSAEFAAFAASVALAEPAAWVAWRKSSEQDNIPLADRSEEP